MNDHSAHTQNDSSSCLTRPRSHFARSPIFLSPSSVAAIDGVYLLLVGATALGIRPGEIKRSSWSSSLISGPSAAVCRCNARS